MSLNVSRVYARRRPSMPTSGSARRRARQRLAAEASRAECERLARDKRDQRQRDKLEQQRQAREELSSYEPWGRPGGGAPNSNTIRFTNLRRRNIYPEDELKGLSDVNVTTWQWPVHRKKGPHRVHEDSQLRFQYGDGMRQAVDNDIRYRLPQEQQQSYKLLLDELVDTKKNAMKDERKKDVELDKKLGWTDNNTFNKIKSDHRRSKRSSLALPAIGKSHSIPKEKMKEKVSTVEKLPDINGKANSDTEVTKERSNDKKENSNCKNEDHKSPNEKHEKHKEDIEKENKNREGRRSKKNTIVKRLSNGDRVKRMVVVDNDTNGEVPTKSTPESAILRMTGGIELVPLLARRRRVGARTLPSSDVTRPPEDPCEWRNLICDEYLQELKHQMQVKCQQREESRRDSAEDCRRHHETWAALWGRPGHGAPQPGGRLCRNNLTHLLYLAPLPPPPPVQ